MNDKSTKRVPELIKVTFDELKIRRCLYMRVYENKEELKAEIKKHLRNIFQRI